jgi:hypothetical protein
MHIEVEVYSILLIWQTKQSIDIGNILEFRSEWLVDGVDGNIRMNRCEKVKKVHVSLIER